MTKHRMQFPPQTTLRILRPTTLVDLFQIAEDEGNNGINQDRLPLHTIEFFEGGNAANEALAQLSRATDQAQCTHILADALGEQIDVCLSPGNMAPTLSRLQGFAAVLVVHLDCRLDSLKAGDEQPLKVRMPTWGVAT